MKKLLFVLALCALMCVTFSVTSFAATTNEFGEVETSDTINLDGMAEDDDVYCVLFDGTEYHTYPSRYIVTNNTTMAWKFDRINEAFDTNYTRGSVIRIQVPAHITTLPSITGTLFGWKDKENKVVEVSFPEDTIVSTFAWGAFEKSLCIESVVVPNTVTLFDGTNTFNGCKALKSVVFEEGSQLTSLPNSAFAGCTSLTELVLPPSITTIGSKLTGGDGSKLTKLVLSPNLTTVTGDAMLNAVGYNSPDHFIEIYMPGNIATGEGSTTGGNFIGRGNKGDLKKYVIFFTGTEAEAKALVAKYSGDICFCDANIVAYDPTKTSGTDYLGMDPYTTDITVNTNRVIVYGYNLCDAFYNGEHAEGTVLNSCQFGCGRNCGQVSLLDNPQHNLSTRTEFGNDGYLDAFAVIEQCAVCGTKTLDEAIDALFTSKGYSAKAFGDSIGLVQGYGINKDAINEYKQFIADFDFGILACANVNGGEISPLPTDSGVIDVTFNNMANNYIEISVVGIPSDHTDTAFIFCIYVTEGDRIYYIDNGTMKTATQGISYNSLIS